MTTDRRGRPRRRKSGGRKKSKSSPGIPPLEPLDEPPEIGSFREWDLDPAVLEAIDEMGIATPTPIQALAIGPVLEGRDVIAKAETGTGKTLAFGAPLMSRVNPRRASILGLVLSPTRELAEQVFKVLRTLGERRGIKVAFVVGGEEMPPQIQAVRSGAQVVVGTPGRILDLQRQRFLSFPWTEFVVLDEADKMLEIGFLDDVRAILKAVAPEAQKLLFSATFPPDLLALARQHSRDPVEVATASGLATVDTIAQYAIRVSEEDGVRELSRLIDKSEPEDTFMVFCHRRTDVNRVMRQMERRRYPVRALHGGYEQDARFAVMEAFRRGEVKALIATDVASRGLDIVRVTHVVNFGVPRDSSDYTHRIGRTGRAGREGTAITFVFPAERRRWSSITRSVPFPIQELESVRELRDPAGARSSGEGDGSEGKKGRGRGGAGRKPRKERGRGPGGEPGEKKASGKESGGGGGDAAGLDAGRQGSGRRGGGGRRRRGRGRRGGRNRPRSEARATTDGER